MKLKCDFITNSSSSSFIVAWPTKIKEYGDVKQFMMFTEQAQVVFEDAKKKNKEMEDGLIQGLIIDDSEQILNMVTEEISNGYFEGCDSYFDDKEFQEICRVDIETEEHREKSRKFYEKVEEKNKKTARGLAEKFVSKNKGKFLYFFSYSDNDGEFYSKMEHDDIFSKLEYLRISHH